MGAFSSIPAGFPSGTCIMWNRLASTSERTGKDSKGKARADSMVSTRMAMIWPSFVYLSMWLSQTQECAGQDLSIYQTDGQQYPLLNRYAFKCLRRGLRSLTCVIALHPDWILLVAFFKVQKAWRSEVASSIKHTVIRLTWRCMLTVSSISSHPNMFKESDMLCQQHYVKKDIIPCRKTNLLHRCVRFSH